MRTLHKSAQKDLANSQLGEVYVAYRNNGYEAQERPKISCSEEAATFLWNILPQDEIAYQEVGGALYLNRQNKVLAWAVHFRGGIASTVIDPKVIGTAALLTGASTVIMFHNHPSGNLNPSKEDERLTQRLNGGLNFLDIRLLDHIIITPVKKYYSFADDSNIL